MKKRVVLSALACALLVGATSAQAKTDKKTLVNHVIQEQTAKHKPAPEEIISGMQQTFAALQALRVGKKADAQKALESATQSFDAALKANPALDLIPVDERFQAYAFLGSADVIAARIKLAQQLLKAHDTQTAMAALAPLKDELDISLISIPMKLYPAATKKALEALKKGDEQAALDAIAEAMNSLVVDVAIVPTPLLSAQDLILEASQLDTSKKEEAQKILEAAKEELKRAELLGYTSRHDADYKVLNADIEALQKEIKGKNVVAKLYDTLKKDFKRFVSKAKKAYKTPEQIAEEKVNAFEKKEVVKAIKKKGDFRQEAQQDQQKVVQ